MYIKCITHKYCTHSLYTSSLGFILTLIRSYTSPFPSLFFLSFLSPRSSVIVGKSPDCSLVARFITSMRGKSTGKLGYISIVSIVRSQILIDILIRNIQIRIFRNFKSMKKIVLLFFLQTHWLHIAICLFKK